MKNFFLFFLFLFSSILFAQDAYLSQFGRLSIPFDNRGVIGNVTLNGKSEEGKIDSIVFLFSAGFFLSGKNNDSIWANAQAYGSRYEDYQPGNVDSIFSNPLYSIYTLNVLNGDFNQSWTGWKDAVKLGADFYDGDGDGIYNPVDLNGNNKWDPDEDRPDLLGDFTGWCVYNDGVPTEDRVYNTQSLGIEIHQTVFAFYPSDANSEFDARACTFFVRYKLINTGKVSDKLDSVYFGGWADTDLGGTDGYNYDLAGCDTLENSGYIYKEGVDPSFGINSPAHFVKILQGPYSYIPEETFIDNNFNGEYDEGEDTPVDTAYNYKGEYMGTDILPGAKNLGMTSFIAYNPSIGNPDNQQQIRFYLNGKTQNGKTNNPCVISISNPGIVLGGVDCSKIPPQFMFSGDPVTQTGWINNYSEDQMQLASTGPFTLKVGKPVTIIIAHIIGRGSDSLNSIIVSREFSEEIEGFYKSNFSNIVVSVNEKNVKSVPSSFILYQNYPNPFNPSTTLSFDIGHSSFVSLKIYDVLGREVATLVNEEKQPGSYEVKFSSASGVRNLASGIYFYRLQAGSFIQTRKMILLK